MKAGVRKEVWPGAEYGCLLAGRMQILIKGAKGKKDRTVSLSDGILELLRK
jgi:hypothetical protein